jgi:sarcosine oxidase delta subunit
LKETTAYRSEYLVMECPYCGERNYIDVADDMGEGHIPEQGRKIRCDNPDCKQVFLVVPNY